MEAEQRPAERAPKAVEIQTLEKILGGLPGIHGVSTSFCNLGSIKNEQLRLVAYGDLPHAAIRWAGGGQVGQVLAQVEFSVSRTEEGWRMLEFIAYVIRSSSRGGSNMQIRPTALPPSTAFGNQFGTTLKFQIDIFSVVTGDNLEPLLKTIQVLADDLEEDIRSYGKIIFKAP